MSPVAASVGVADQTGVLTRAVEDSLRRLGTDRPDPAEAPYLPA